MNRKQNYKLGKVRKVASTALLIATMFAPIAIEFKIAACFIFQKVYSNDR